MYPTKLMIYINLVYYVFIFYRIGYDYQPSIFALFH